MFTVLHLFLITGLSIGFIYYFTNSNVKERFQYTDPQSEFIIKKLKRNLISLFEKKKFRGILKILNSKNILDIISITPGEKSFTINKKNISLCLKNNQTGRYYDENSLMFVTLHEIAHVVCPDVGHTNTFKIIFKKLLEYAESKNMYSSSIPFVQNYCP